MNKVKISLTVKEETDQRLQDLAREIFPHVSVSRGDVVDYLVGKYYQDKDHEALVDGQWVRQGCEGDGDETGIRS